MATGWSRSVADAEVCPGSGRGSSGPEVRDRAGDVRVDRCLMRGGAIGPTRLLTECFVAVTDAAAAVVHGNAVRPHAADGGGIEPVLHLGIREELQRGRTFEETLDDAPTPPVAERPGGEGLVERITDELARILADVSDRQLDEVAVAWSQTCDLDGADPADLAAFAVGSDTCASGTRRRGHVSCWLGRWQVRRLKLRTRRCTGRATIPARPPPLRCLMARSSSRISGPRQY